MKDNETQLVSEPSKEAIEIAAGLCGESVAEYLKRNKGSSLSNALVVDRHLAALRAERDRLVEQKNDLYETYMSDVFILRQRAATADAELKDLKELADRQFYEKEAVEDALISAEAVVAKLPKTADGVPVVPGDAVYFRFEGEVTRMAVTCDSWSGSEIDVSPLIKTRYFCTPVCHESVNCGVLNSISNVSIGSGSVVPEMCYSTRAAAVAAETGDNNEG